MQENNERDLSLGFLLTFLSYLLIGFFGYFGFMGMYFMPHMMEIDSKDPNGPLSQNCIQMFEETDIFGFFLRIVISACVFSSFPILYHFFRAGILKVFFESKVGEKRAKKVNRISFAEQVKRTSQESTNIAQNNL